MSGQHSYLWWHTLVRIFLFFIAVLCVLQVFFRCCSILCTEEAFAGDIFWVSWVGIMLMCVVISNLLTICLLTFCMHKQWLLLLRYKKHSNLEQPHVLFWLTRQVVLSTLNSGKDRDIKLEHHGMTNGIKSTQTSIKRACTSLERVCSKSEGFCKLTNIILLVNWFTTWY